MLYMLVNRTRTDLTGEQYERLREMAKTFYADVPEGLRLRGDWAANDGSRTFALLESDDAAQVRAMADRFEGLVDIEIVPVTAISGWRD
jgi:hypothetical protein